MKGEPSIQDENSIKKPTRLSRLLQAQVFGGEATIPGENRVAVMHLTLAVAHRAHGTVEVGWPGTVETAGLGRSDLLEEMPRVGRPDGPEDQGHLP